MTSTYAHNSPLTARQSLIVIGTVLAASLVAAGTAIAAILWFPGARDAWLAILAWSTFVQALASVLVVHVCLRRFGQSWGALGFVRPNRRLLHLLWQVPVGIITLLIVQGVALWMFGNNRNGSGAINHVGTQVGFATAIAVFIAAAALTPIWEEAVFRGVIHRGFRHRLGPWAAALPSALIFAAVHGVPILLPYSVMLGLILAYLCEFHRSLWGSTLFHITINSIAGAAILSALVS